jgi:hypothetical protein
MQSAPRRTDFRPARSRCRFHLADELLTIRYRHRYLFAIRLLLEHSKTLKLDAGEIIVLKSLDFTDTV